MKLATPPHQRVTIEFFFRQSALQRRKANSSAGIVLRMPCRGGKSRQVAPALWVDFTPPPRPRYRFRESWRNGVAVPGKGGRPSRCMSPLFFPSQTRPCSAGSLPKPPWSNLTSRAATATTNVAPPGFGGFAWATLTKVKFSRELLVTEVPALEVSKGTLRTLPPCFSGYTFWRRQFSS